MIPYVRLAAWSPEVYATWANTPGRWKQVSTAAVLPVEAAVTSVTSELLLMSHSLKDAKFLSLPFNFSNLFPSFNKPHPQMCTQIHTRACTHVCTSNTDTCTHSTVLENKELVCVLFGVNQNVRLKLLFYAFESHTHQTLACLPKLWTSKGIFHRKTHTHQNNTHPQENNTYKPQKDAISTKSIPIKEGSVLEDLRAH